MEFFRKLKQKIADGWLKEVAGELRWAWQYVRRYRLTILVHVLLGAAGILLSLAGSVASKFLIDAVTGHHTGTIGGAAAWMVGLMLGNIAMKSVSGRIGAVLNIKVHNELQWEVYRRILFADWQSLEAFRSGDLTNRLSGDVNTLASGVISLIPSLISGCIQFVGSLCIILYYDPAMALIALLGVPVSAICSRLMVRRMRRHNQEMKELNDDIVSFHQSSFQNLTVIKAFGIGELFSGRMAEKQEKYREAYLSYNRFSLCASAFLSVVGLVVSLSCLGWSVYRLWSGVITFGTMTLFLQLASVLSASFSALIGLIPTVISLSTSAGRIMAVTELDAETCEQDDAFRQETEFSIALSDLDFSYQSGERVLSRACIHTAPGDLIALTGPSGEGKTTLLRILLGLVSPQSGTAELIGGSGRRYPLSAATRSVFGYVPQGGSLFAGTIAENLRLTSPDASEEELWAALSAACADEFVCALPDGLDHRVGDRDSGLSEGQAQRLAVARALLRGAPILLLDEATSALDMDTEAEMLRRLMGSGRVRTCILVTHRPGALKYCTGGYHVHDGLVTKEE